MVGWGLPGATGIWAMSLAGVGVLILRALPGHPVGTLLVWAGVGSAVVDAGFHVAQTYGWDVLFATIGSAGWMVPMGLLLTAIARFPDGAWAFRGARLVLAGMWCAIGLGVLIAPIAPALPSGGGTFVVDNPWVVDWWTDLPPWAPFLPTTAFRLLGLAILVASPVALFRGDEARRRQIGVVVLAVGLVGVAGVVSAMVDDDGALGALFATVMAVGVAAIPFSIFVAVTRYRLYDVDRLVSRTVSYALVLVLLGALYSAMVVTLRSLFPVEGDLPVAVSTLVVALAFLPLVRRVQRVVDRRFFRSRYDAGVVVARVADDLRGSLDVEEVSGRVVAVVDEVLAPEVVGVWVAQEGP